jgi:prepilin-type N-terminal cleavage/methylation domain-containing protein
VLIGKNKRQALKLEMRQCAGAILRSNRAQSGFSLIELLVVMAVLLIVAAFAVPTVVNTIDAYKVRGSMTSINGLTQRCRLLALKKNSSAHLYVQSNSGTVTMFCKDITDSVQTLVSSDPQIQLSSQFSIPGTPTGGPTLLTATTMWGSSGSTFNTDSDPYFNSRGLPCNAVSVGTACTSVTGYVYYVKYTSRSSRWMAVSISPASRIQDWFWNGTGWGN